MRVLGLAGVPVRSSPAVALVALVSLAALGSSCDVVPPSNPYDPDAPLEQRLTGRIVGRLLLPGHDFAEPRTLFVEDRSGARLLDAQGASLAVKTRLPDAALPEGFDDESGLGAGGTFEVSLPPGLYSVVFDASHNDEPLFEDATVRGIDVVSGFATQIAVAPVMRSRDSLIGAVSGEVRGAGAGSFVVRLAPTGGAIDDEKVAVMSGDGAFRFRQVPPGEYTVVVSGEGYAPSTTRAFEVGDAEFVLPAPLELTVLGALFDVVDWSAAAGLPPFAPYLPTATAHVEVGPLALFDADAPVTAHARVYLAGDEPQGAESGWQALSAGALPLEVDLDDAAPDGPRALLGQLRLCFGGECSCTPSDANDCSAFRAPLVSAPARIDVVVDRAPAEAVSVVVSGEPAGTSVVVNCERFAGSACPLATPVDPYQAPVSGLLLDATSRVVGYAVTLDDDQAPTSYVPLLVQGGVASLAGFAPGIDAVDGAHTLSLWAVDAAGNVGLVHERDIVVDLTAVELADPALSLSGTALVTLPGDVVASEVLPGIDALVDVAVTGEAPAAWRIVDAGGSATVTGDIVGELQPYLGPEPVRFFGSHLADAQLFVEAADAAGNVSTHLLPRALRLYRAGALSAQVSLENQPDAAGAVATVTGEGGVLVEVAAGEDKSVDVGGAVPVAARFTLAGALALDGLPVPDTGGALAARYTVAVSAPAPYLPVTRVVDVTSLATSALGPVALARPRGDVAGRFVLAGRESASTNSGIQVTLLDALGDDVAGTTTLANGSYRFSDVPADTGYRVVGYFAGYSPADVLGLSVSAGETTVVAPDENQLPTPVVLEELAGDFVFCASSGLLQESCSPLLYTNADTVEIGGLSFAGVAEYRVSTTSFLTGDGAPAWQPVTPSGGSYVAPVVTLDGLPDGVVTAYLQLRAAPGSEGAVLSSSITYDTAAPTGVALSALAPAGALPGFTRLGAVDVVVTAAAPAAGAAPLKEARVAFAVAAPPAPPAFSCAHATTCSVPLDTLAEGLHRAYAFSCDAAGNCSAASAPAPIVLDTTPPRVANGAAVAPSAPWVSPDGAAYATRSAQYDVAVWAGTARTAGNANVLDVADQPVPDVVAARFALTAAMTGAAFTAFEPVPAPGASFVLAGPALPGVDGTSTVTAQLRDAAGNTSSLEPSPFSFALTLDTAPPVASFALSSDAPATSSTAVTLTVSSPSPGGAVRVWLNQTGVFDPASPSTYEERALPLVSTAYTLTAPAAPAGDGTKTVYARFFDAAGNSVDRADSILLDRTPPTALSVVCGSCVVSPTGVIATNASTRQVVLDVLASDNSGVIAAVETAVNGGAVTSSPYTGSVTVTLLNSDTTQTVAVVFVDGAGNKSAAESLAILLDRAAPTAPALSITGRAADDVPSTTLTRTLDVTLAPSATGATEMLLSNNAGFVGATWQPYATSVPWVLTPGDSATKQVHVRFRDHARNETSAVAGTIALDQTPPTSPTILLANGSDWVTSELNVPVAVSASGATQLRLSSDGTFGTEAWGSIVSPTTMNLPAGQGLKRGYVVFRDAAGNESTVVSDTVTLDSQPPTSPSVVIDGGASYARSVSVTVSLAAVGASEMRLSTDGTFDGEPWVPFQSAAVVLLPAGDCTAANCKTVSAHFRDAAGNQTTSATTDSITLDTTPPTIPLVTTPSLVTSGASTTINIAAAVTETFFARYEVAGGATCYPAGFTQVSTTRTQTSFTVCLDQKTGDSNPETSLFENSLRIRAVDQAGNVSGESSVVIVRDTVAPATPQLATAAEVVNASLFAVTLAAASTSQLDATFRRYELRGGGFASFTPTAQLDQLTFSLVQGDGGACGGSCPNVLEVRAVDEAGNTSGIASVTITEDSLPPPAPVLEIDAAEVNADRVSVQLAAPRPADPAQEPNFDHYEIRGGALVDFVAVCPTSTARCAAPLGLVGEADRFLFDDVNGNSAASPTEILGLFFALDDESDAELSVRAVDKAGNASFASAAYVEERSEAFLTEGISNRYAPAVHGDRVAWAGEDQYGGATLVVEHRGPDDRFGTADDEELVLGSLGILGAGGIGPDVSQDRVMWHALASGDKQAIYVRAAGLDHTFGTADDGTVDVCNCGTDARVTPATSTANEGRLFGRRLVYRSSDGFTGLVVVEPAPCGEFCPLGLGGALQTRTVNLANTATATSPAGYGDVIVYLDNVAGTCSLRALHAGTDKSFGTPDDVTNIVDTGVDCYPRPAVFAPFSGNLSGDANVIAYRKYEYVNVVRAGTNGRFDGTDTKVATTLRAWSFDVDGKNLVAGGHSNGVLFRQSAGADGLLATADDVVTEDSYAYGWPRDVALSGDLWVYRSNERGTPDVKVRELAETRWLYTGSSGNERMPQIAGDRVIFGHDYAGTMLLEVSTGRVANSASLPVAYVAGYNHHSLSGQRVLGNVGNELIVWQPGADATLGTADDTKAVIAAGSTVYYANQAPDSLSEPYLELDGNVAVWLDNVAGVRIASAGADAVFGNGDDCTALVHTPSGWIDRVRTSGNRIAFDDAWTVRVRETGAGGLCSTGDDTVADISTGLPGVLSGYSPDIDGARVVFACNLSGTGMGLCMVEAGSDGRLTTTGDNVLTVLASARGAVERPVLSGDYVAWVDYDTNAPEVVLLHIPDGTLRNVSRQPGDRRQIHMDQGNVVWADVRLGTFDVWTTRLP